MSYALLSRCHSPGIFLVLRAIEDGCSLKSLESGTGRAKLAPKREDDVAADCGTKASSCLAVVL